MERTLAVLQNQSVVDTLLHYPQNKPEHCFVLNRNHFRSGFDFLWFSYYSISFLHLERCDFNGGNGMPVIKSHHKM